METRILVKDVHVNPETGYLTYFIQSETVDGNQSWKGPVKQYGCDVQMLRDRFHGNLEEFESYIKTEHAPLVGAHPQIVETALSRKGKEL